MLFLTMRDCAGFAALSRGAHTLPSQKNLHSARRNPIWSKLIVVVALFDDGLAGRSVSTLAPAFAISMDKSNLKQFSERVSHQLFGHILPFWAGPVLDHEKGGWMAWLSNDLKPDRSQPKGLIVNSRILWAFSAAHRARPDPVYRQMADRAYEFVTGKFWDMKYRGAFWRLNDDGQMLDDSKKIYGQAFYIYALTEYYRAFDHPDALKQGIELFELMERHAHDRDFGGYWEVCRRDWSEAADSRLSDKDMNEKKSMNNHLHILEAYTNLYRVWKDPRVAQRLRELIRLFEQHILDARTKHLNHFFDEEWRVRSD